MLLRRYGIPWMNHAGKAVSLKGWLSSKPVPSAYESCLHRVKTVTNSKKFGIEIAKMAGLLLEVTDEAELKLQKAEDKAEAELKLQKAEDKAELKLQKADFETKLAASTAKLQSELSFMSKRYVNVMCMFPHITWNSFNR